MYDPPPGFTLTYRAINGIFIGSKKAPLVTFMHSSVIFLVIFESGKSASSSMFCLSVIIIIGDEKGILQRLSVWKQDVKKRCIVWRKMEAVNKTILEGFSQCAVARITENPPSSPSRHLEKFCCSAADLWPITFLLSAPFTFLPRRAEL